MPFTVAVVGGGLVGALEACLLARRGFQVTLFESRHDGRSEPNYFGRSINLAISLRGISALKKINMQQIVEEQAIPMGARMIHDRNGKTRPIPYDPDGRCINSIERAKLNNFLLDKAEHELKVRLLFNHKLVDMDADRGELMFRYRGADGDQNKIIRHQFDLILGCDGARSNVRSLLARQAPVEVRQQFIEHGYLELRVEADEKGAHRLPVNYLHIWPRGDYMMIALPNKDATFTCTLFMPFAMMQKLHANPDEGLEFFRKNFADAVPLIGPEEIKRTLGQVKASSLIYIKCRPYHYKGRVALLGDSAHAMVPFYGQGMNCGFEDCLVLDELLDQHLGEQPLTAHLDPDTMETILANYNDRRCPNGHSMVDLALYNYIEMRHHVNNWSFLLRKQLDNLLYRLMPTKWIPLYTMVTFSRIPVNECVELRKKQDDTLDRCLRLAGALCLVSLTAGAWLLRSQLPVRQLVSLKLDRSLKALSFS